MYALKAYALSGAIKKEKETETEIQRETEIQKRGTKGQDNEPDTNTYFLFLLLKSSCPVQKKKKEERWKNMKYGENAAILKPHERQHCKVEKILAWEPNCLCFSLRANVNKLLTGKNHLTYIRLNSLSVK